VIDHHGCMNSGHYVAKAWVSGRSAWYRFSDSLTEQCGPAAVHSPNAYILFYERIDDAGESE
jgi:ubiquitin C-terminal hydrolase